MQGSWFMISVSAVERTWNKTSQSWPDSGLCLSQSQRISLSIGSVERETLIPPLESGPKEQMLHRNVQRFRGGLVLNAH